MAKSCKRFLLLLLVVTFFTLIGYLGLSLFYNGRYANGTWINGIYCTGKTAQQVNELLIKQTQIQDFVIIDDTGKTY